MKLQFTEEIQLFCHEIIDLNRHISKFANQ
jgi:hypothetical protein